MTWIILAFIAGVAIGISITLCEVLTHKTII
jgi:capsular polysaccharide biosynthesis protein